MKKVLSFLFILLLLGSFAFGQWNRNVVQKQGFKYSIGVNVGFPVGDISKTSNEAAGLNTQIYYAFSQSLELGFWTGASFFEKIKNGETYYDVQNGHTIQAYSEKNIAYFIPFNLSAKVFYYKHLYIEPQGGAVLLSTRSGQGAMMKMNYALNAGIAIRDDIDLSVDYNRVIAAPDLEFIGVKLSYLISL